MVGLFTKHPGSKVLTKTKKTFLPAAEPGQLENEEGSRRLSSKMVVYNGCDFKIQIPQFILWKIGAGLSGG